MSLNNHMIYLPLNYIVYKNGKILHVKDIKDKEAMATGLK
jgi:hypothetical protein